MSLLSFFSRSSAGKDVNETNVTRFVRLMKRVTYEVLENKAETAERSLFLWRDSSTGQRGGCHLRARKISRMQGGRAPLPQCLVLKLGVARFSKSSGDIPAAATFGKSSNTKFKH